MSALSTIIAAAVADAVAANAKLFDPKKIERAPEVLTRAITKALTREPKTDGEDAAAAASETPPAGGPVSADDPRAKAYAALRKLAGAVAPMQIGGGVTYVPPEADTPAVAAFADMPPRERWLFVTSRANLTAWAEFFDATIPNLARRQITETHGGAAGIFLPWPWPPSKTGKVYTADEAPELPEIAE